MSSMRIVFSVLLVLASATALAQPQISYMFPDLGTTRFGTYIEIVAPFGASGSYGTDGMYANNVQSAVRVECARPSDTSVVTIGPVSVSWNGRLISTVIFVDPLARPNSPDWRQLRTEFRIPLRVVTSAGSSNVDTFYVVQPWPMGDMRAESDRGFGSGRLGIRSRRGAMLVDSLIMAGSPAYTVSLADCDPGTPGNQGFLPFVLLSPGVIYGQLGSVIDVGASGAQGGPGGGGGGGGYANNLTAFGTRRGFEGGNGFTGGGPGGDNNAIGSNTRQRPGNGSGSEPGSGTDGGSTMNGIRGGSSGSAFENAGGGTGHPFGESGVGCEDRNNCPNVGRFGAGSGYQDGRRGGGGGYGEDGAGDAVAGGTTSGGKRHGNAAIVPLAGGSGGASGNPAGAEDRSASGGGGGGAISIHALHVEEFTIRANGATTAPQSVNAGGGSGGGVVVGSRIDIRRAVSPQTNPGEVQGQFFSGGVGRRRIDARGAGGTIAGIYNGAGLDTLQNVLRRVTVRGFGNGSDLALWLRGENDQWIVLDTIKGYGTSWQRQYVLPGTDTLYYMALAQRVVTASEPPFRMEPEWVLSQSGWNILRIYGPPIIEGPTTFAMNRYACPGSVVLDTIEIRNAGESPLELFSATFPAGSGFTIVEPTAFPDTVQPFELRFIVVRYDKQAAHTGTVNTQLTIVSNDTAAARRPFVVNVSIAIEPFDLQYTWRFIPLGTLGDTLNYGTVCVGDEQDDELVVRNLGSSPATLMGFRSSAAGLVFTTGNLPFALPAAGFRNLRVHFTAKQEGLTVIPVLLDVAECPQPDTIFVKFVGRVPRMTLVGDGQFGDVVVGTVVNRSIELRNDGSSDLSFGTLPPLPAPFTVLRTIPALPATIPPGGSLRIDIAFAPTSSSEDTSVLTLRSLLSGSACADSLKVVIAGRGRTRSIALSKDAIDMGGVDYCATAVDSVSITNTGSTPITLLYPAFVNGADAPQFTITQQPNVDVTLEPGQSATYVVRFTPAQQPSGVKTASLAIRTAGNGVGAVNVTLQATRVEPVVSGPRIVEFGTVPLGIPTVRNETYTNGGPSDIGVSGATSSAIVVTAVVNPFGLVASNSGFGLSVTVQPQSEGFATDTVWIQLSDPCVDSIPVIVRYSAVSGRVTVPNIIFFGTVSQCATGRDSILITNPSSAAVDLINVVVEGTNAGLFTIENANVVLNRTMTPTDSILLYVRFDPRGSTDGLKQASLVLRIRLNNQPTRVVTQLEGTRRTVLTGAPPNVLFGSIDVGTASDQRFTLVNTGAVDVNITSIRLRSNGTSPFTIAPTAVPLRVPAGGTVSIPVTFAPLTDGFFSDFIDIEIDAPCTDRRVVEVSGTGRLNIELIVIMPQQTNIDPSTDNHRWPVLAAVASAQTPMRNARVILDVRYRTDMFVAQSVVGGTIVSAVSTAGETLLRVEFAPVTANTDTVEIGAIVGQITLGRTDSTLIELVDGEIILPNSTPTVRPNHGFMRTTFCSEGGDRFLEQGGSLGIRVAPQPVTDRFAIDVNAFEAGEHTLRMVDVTGREVAAWTWVHRRGDATKVVEVSASVFSSGGYTLVLSTPTRTRTLPVQVIR